MSRYCESQIINDLAKKMVFIGGPRQVGKTTLSKSILADHYQHGRYFNWDLDEDRRAILEKQWSVQNDLIVFDELHKYPRWKQWIKGVYDSRPEGQNYLVTGSARLDVYRRGGDSLMGRYHYWRLHPFTLDERPSDMSLNEAYQRLLSLGGFPEPFLGGDAREAKRWRRERFDRILKEDVRDLEQIRDIQLLYLLLDLLRTRVGGAVVSANLAKDLQVSPNTVKAWLKIVERMYIGFSVYPYTTRLPRAIQKPIKFYFYDNADVEKTGGARLENLVATHLLKRLNFLEDYNGDRCSLHYVRDKDGREVDFATVINGKVTDLIEVKESDSAISRSLQYYHRKLKPVQTVQIVGNLKDRFDKNDIAVMNPCEFFQDPPWQQ